MDDWSLVFDRKKRNIWDLSRFIYLYSLLLFFILNFRTTILHRKICSRHFYVLSCVKYNTELQDNNKTSRATIVFWKRLQFVWPPTTALFRNQARTLGMKLNEDSHMRLDQCSNAIYDFDMPLDISISECDVETKPQLWTFDVLFICVYI